MTDCSKFDSEAQEYFDTLPPYLQENIMQSNSAMCTKAQLQEYCKNILDRD